MNAMDGTNRRSRAVGKAAVAHKRLSVIEDNARGDCASNQIFEDESPFNLTKNQHEDLRQRYASTPSHQAL
jgi:hypothetical protein